VIHFLINEQNFCTFVFIFFLFSGSKRLRSGWKWPFHFSCFIPPIYLSYETHIHWFTAGGRGISANSPVASCECVGSEQKCSEGSSGSKVKTLLFQTVKWQHFLIFIKIIFIGFFWIIHDLEITLFILRIITFLFDIKFINHFIHLNPQFSEYFHPHDDMIILKSTEQRTWSN